MVNLIEALRDDNGDTRLRAASRLAEVGDWHAVEPLCAALKDRHPDVRAASALALGLLGDVRAVLPLCGALRDDYRDTRLRAAEALGAIGDERAVAHLCRLFQDSQLDVRNAASNALVRIGDAAVEPVCALLASSESSPSLQARNYMVAIAGPADRFGYGPIKNAQLSIRRLAASALGSIGDPRAVPVLCSALGDDDPVLCVEAATALQRISDPAAIEPLCGALKHRETTVRKAAANALASIRDLRCVVPLCALMKEDNRTTASAAHAVLLSLCDALALLPHRVLADEPMRPDEKLDCLWALSRAPASLARWMAIGSITNYCKNVQEDSSIPDAVKRGAVTVLAEIENRAIASQLVRASHPDSVTENQLLRAAVGGDEGVAEHEMLRSSQRPEEPVERDKPPLLGRLLGRIRK